MIYNSGDQVLVRATVAADGRTVMVTPGVELPIGAVQVAAELPAAADAMPHGIVLMFETQGDLDNFVNTFGAEE